MKVIIIGGVAGGASAAARLRRLDESAEIIMLERGDYVSFANCGLPYYVGGEITEKESLLLQTPEGFRSRFNIDVRVRSEAVQIFPQEKMVRIKNLSDGTVYEESYDKLILSPGAEPLKPPLPGIDDPRIFTLRNVPDAFKIRDYIDLHKPQRALVVGGGYIGVEMAENLSNAGLDVTIAELSDHLIAPLDFDMACLVHNYLRAKGIRLLLKTGVKGFTSAEHGILAEIGETQHLFDFVVLSVGVRPESALAKDAGLKLNPKGAILVDPQMLTSDENIYAVGDAVEITNYVTGKAGYIPLAGPANKQGRIAADNICGVNRSYSGTQGSAVLKIFEMTVATTGLNEATAIAAGFETEKVYVFPASHASYYPGGQELFLKLIFEKPGGKILGAEIVGFDGVDKRCDVIATAIRAGMTVFDLTELELCYAPPYSSAKDPVNMAGYVAENVLLEKVKQFYWEDCEKLRQDTDAVLLDVRTPYEFQHGAIDGALHIPVDVLRDNLAHLDKSKRIYVYCASGQRSYLACRILSQHGFDCCNLAGGYKLYALVRSELAVSMTKTEF